MIINRKRIIRNGGSTPAAVSQSDVNFYDYDGTLLFAYTIAQANALSALPTAPTHTGLTFQEWNYTLTQVNGANRPMDVGATYITSDGKTRLYIQVFDILRSNILLTFSQTVSEGVTVDWGDGSNTQAFEGTGLIIQSHQYMAIGSYTISLQVAEGCELGLGDADYGGIIGGSGSDYGWNWEYGKLLKKAELGARITEIGNGAFYSCNCFEFITIPNTITSISDYAFSYNYAITTIILPRSITELGREVFNENNILKRVIIPNSITSIKSHSFMNCRSLVSLILPDALTELGELAFWYCEFITSLVIPSGITVIGQNVFDGCSFLKEVHFLPTTPPSSPGGLPIGTDLVIYVPTASLGVYQVAEGWVDYAAHMVGE